MFSDFPRALSSVGVKPKVILQILKQALSGSRHPTPVLLRLTLRCHLKFVMVTASLDLIEICGLSVTLPAGTDNAASKKVLNNSGIVEDREEVHCVNASIAVG